MSDHLRTVEPTPITRELRVIILDSANGHIIGPTGEVPASLVDIAPEGEVVAHEHRATHIGSRLGIRGLNLQSAIKHLGHVDGVVGYAVRPPSGSKIDLEKAGLQTFSSDEIIEAMREIEPKDLKFIIDAFLAIKRPLGK